MVDTRMGMELLGPYLAHCHIGNGVPVPDKADLSGPDDRQDYTWTFSELRKGVANIPEIIEDLKSVGYSGYISLEDFSLVNFFNSTSCLYGSKSGIRVLTVAPDNSPYISSYCCGVILKSPRENNTDSMVSASLQIG